MAENQVFRQARDIVESTVADTIQQGGRFLAPKTTNVKRYVNRHRATFRPTEPVDLDFEVY